MASEGKTFCPRFLETIMDCNSCEYSGKCAKGFYDALLSCRRENVELKTQLAANNYPDPEIAELEDSLIACRAELSQVREDRDNLRSALLEASAYVPEHHGPVTCKIKEALSSTGKAGEK